MAFAAGGRLAQALGLMSPIVLIVPAALSILAVLSRRSGHVSVQGAEVFTFPTLLIFIVALCSSLIGFAPFWVHFVKPEMAAPEIKDYFLFGVYGGLGILFAAYLYCYRVIVGIEVFSVGAFSRRQFRLVDIREVKLQKGQRSSEYVVCMRSGKRLRFSALLSGFEALTTLLRPTQ